MPSPFTTDMETNSQYSSCETLDSHRSSECDEKSEVNGNSHKKTRKISAEHTDYIVKERVTRKEPPKPAYNPMQFVAMKPSNLHTTAQEQLKKAEEIKKVQKESTAVKKEEPEDWQNNLDNWKSSRRKRVEHIIDRVVEVKKLEEEEHDRNRRSIKTFSELMEERGSRRKLSTLAIYAEEDTTLDMSDLTPVSDENSSSDKMKTNSDNNSDKEKHASDTTDDVFNNNNNNNNDNNNGSSNNNNKFHSTALIKDVIHKKQEANATAAKIQQQKQQREDEPSFVKTEVEQRITTDLSGVGSGSGGCKEDVYKMTMSAKITTTTSMSATKTSIRSLDARERDYTYDDAIEDYKTRVSQAVKLDLPKIDINKKRELFEQQQQQASSNNSRMMMEEENSNISTVAAKLGTEIVSIKERISSLRNNLITNGTTSTTSSSSSTLPLSAVTAAAAPPKKVDLAVSTTIKDRLSSLHQQVSSPIDEASKRMLDTPFKNVHEARNEFELKQQQHLQPQSSVSYNTRVSEVAPPPSSSSYTSSSSSSSFVEEVLVKESNESDRKNDSRITEQQYPNPPDVIQHEPIMTSFSSTSTSKEIMLDEINEEESSVSYSENDQIESVMVLDLRDNVNEISTTTNSNIVSSPLAAKNSISIASSSSSPLSPNKISSSSASLMNFIHSNYQPFGDDDEVYESIIIKDTENLQLNELEKSNSVDTACSSSDGNSLMEL